MSRRRREHSRDSSDEDEASLSKRRKVSESSEEIEKRLESLICRVGEKSTSSLESNLEGLSVVLAADLPNFKSQILRILVLCSHQFPEKCTIYGTLVGLLNVRNYNCGGEFVEMMIREFKRLVNQNQYEEGRHIVRFLADLVSCHVISTDSLISLFESFLSVTNEEGVPQARRDWYVHTVLSALPWVGGELSDKVPDRLNSLLSVIKTYIEKKRETAYQGFLRVWSTDEPHPQEEYLQCLWMQIMKLADDNWVEDLIPRPYRAFEGILSESLQHNIPNFVPPPHKEGLSKYPYPKVIFRIFDYTDCPEGPLIPGNHSIERWLVEDCLCLTLKTHRLDKKECALALLSIPGRDKVPISHMVVEVLFGELFRLPVPSYPEVFFTSILIELCKVQPGTVPQVLALASEMLFERLDTMNQTCVDRFVGWFSHHLSNFQFRWSWDEWSECLNEDLSHPKPKFIREVLAKCLRLSYHQRMCESVPESFAPLLPAEPKCYFKYSERIENASELDDAAQTASQRLIACIKQKTKEDDLKTILEEIPCQPSANNGDEDYSPTRLNALMQTLLHLSQKSFSHSCGAIAKFHMLIKWASNSDVGKIDVLRILHTVWRSHPQMMIILVDKMIRTQVVSCATVAKWIFSPYLAKDFTRTYVWEIMHSTIRKMNMHVKKVEMELVDIQDKNKFDLKNDGDEMDEESELMNAYAGFAPSADDVAKVQEKLDSAKSEQKNLFLVIFQRFIMVLSDHMVRSSNSGKDFNTPWFKNTIERLQQMFLMHGDIVQQYMNTLENLLFTAELDKCILTVFHHFVALTA